MFKSDWKCDGPLKVSNDEKAWLFIDASIVFIGIELVVVRLSCPYPSSCPSSCMVGTRACLLWHVVLVCPIALNDIKVDYNAKEWLLFPYNQEIGFYILLYL